MVRVKFDHLIVPVVPHLVSAEQEPPLSCANQAISGEDHEDVEKFVEEAHLIVPVGDNARAEVHDDTEKTGDGHDHGLGVLVPTSVIEHYEVGNGENKEWIQDDPEAYD